MLKSFFLLACLSIFIANSYAGIGRMQDHLALLLPGQSPNAQAARQFAKTEILRLVNELESEKVGRAPLQKSAAVLQRRVISTYLKKHDGLATFNALIKKEHYNQASASALYALLAEAFDIDYRIEHKLWAISITLDPNNENIKLNIPLPGKAPVSEQAFRRNYLDLLRASGIVPAHEWQNPEQAIFEKYYYGDARQLNIQQLAGYLQYLQALEAYDQKQYVRALQFTEQAQLLYDRPVHIVLRKALLLKLAAQDARGSREALFYLFRLWEEAPTAELENDLLQRFVRVADDYLLKDGEEIAFDSIHHYFQQNTQAYPVLAQQLKEIYYLKKASYYAKQLRAAEVMNYMDSLYHYRPNDSEIQQVLAGLLVWSLRGQRNWKQGIESLEYYQKRYPFLQNIPEFKDIDLFYRAEQIRHYFDADLGPNGEQLLQHFERLLSLYGQTPRYRLWILTAYISSSNYYFRAADYVSARYYIGRARQLVPNDPYLEHRWEVLSRY